MLNTVLFFKSKRIYFTFRVGVNSNTDTSFLRIYGTGSHRKISRHHSSLIIWVSKLQMEFFDQKSSDTLKKTFSSTVSGPFIWASLRVSCVPDQDPVTSASFLPEPDPTCNFIFFLNPILQITFARGQDSDSGQLNF